MCNVHVEFSFLSRPSGLKTRSHEIIAGDKIENPRPSGRMKAGVGIGA